MREGNMSNDDWSELVWGVAFIVLGMSVLAWALRHG
jgi:hypothetical protein